MANYRQGFGILQNVWNWGTNLITGGNKAVIDAVTSAAEKNADETLEAFNRYRNDPDAFEQFVKTKKGDAPAAANAKLSEHSTGKKIRTLGIATIAGVGLVGSGLASNLLSSAKTVWANTSNEAGTNSFFYKIFNFFAVLMEKLGLDKNMPGAYSWLVERRDGSNGRIGSGGMKDTADSIVDHVKDNAMTYTALGLGGLGVRHVLKNGNPFSGGGGKGPNGGGNGPTRGGAPAFTTTGFNASNAAKTYQGGLGNAAEEATETVAKKGGLSSLFKMKGMKGNAAVTAVAAVGIGGATLLAGGTKAEAATAAAQVIPGADAVDKIAHGEVKEGLKSGATDVAGIAGFTAGGTAGAALGAQVGGGIGLIFGGVGAAPGAAIGGAIGFIGGGLVGSGVASFVTEKAWEVGDNMAAHFSNAAHHATRPTVAPGRTMAAGWDFAQS